MWFILLIRSFILMFLALVVCINLLVIALSVAIQEGIIKLFKLNPDSSIELFIMQIVLISVICFIITLMLYLLYKHIFKEEKRFKQYFEGSYLLILYSSGLISILNALKPQLTESKLFKLTDFLSPDLAAGMALLFFIALSNYTIFKNLIMERKVFFIKDEKCKLCHKNYLEKLRQTNMVQQRETNII